MHGARGLRARESREGGSHEACRKPTTVAPKSGGIEGKGCTERRGREGVAARTAIAHGGRERGAENGGAGEERGDMEGGSHGTLEEAESEREWEEEEGRQAR
jgi:hypothetical protein